VGGINIFAKQSLIQLLLKKLKGNYPRAKKITAVNRQAKFERRVQVQGVTEGDRR